MFEVNNLLCSGLTGTGMSEPELQRNPVLTDYTVRDLNQDPKLPYEDNTFDVITNVVSVDYLNRPLVSRFTSKPVCFPTRCTPVARGSCLCCLQGIACGI